MKPVDECGPPLTYVRCGHNSVSTGTLCRAIDSFTTVAVNASHSSSMPILFHASHISIPARSVSYTSLTTILADHISSTTILISHIS